MYRAPHLSSGARTTGCPRTNATRRPRDRAGRVKLLLPGTWCTSSTRDSRWSYADLEQLPPVLLRQVDVPFPAPRTAPPPPVPLRSSICRCPARSPRAESSARVPKRSASLHCAPRSAPPSPPSRVDRRHRAKPFIDQGTGMQSAVFTATTLPDAFSKSASPRRAGRCALAATQQDEWICFNVASCAIAQEYRPIVCRSREPAGEERRVR